MRLTHQLKLMGGLLLIWGTSCAEVLAADLRNLIPETPPSLNELKLLEKEGKAYRLPAACPAKRLDARKFNINTAVKDALGKYKANFPNAQNNSWRYTRSLDDGGNIFGYLGYSADKDTPKGFYELTDTGFDYMWTDPLMEDFSISASNGWYDDGKIKGTAMLVMFDYIWGYYYFEIDFYTGEISLIKDYFSWANGVFYNSDLNSSGDTIYGFAINFDDGLTYWSSAPANEPYKVTFIAPAEETYCYSLCRGFDNETYYGVTDAQKFVSINPATGTQTEIATVPDAENMANYNTGLVANTESKLIYWNAYSNDRRSVLYKVTTDGQFTEAFEFPTQDQFVYFVTTDSFIMDNQPYKPEFDSISFVNGSLTGNVTFILPQNFGDGSPLPTTLVCNAFIDGQYYDTLMGTPGEKLTVDFTVKDRGYHIFGLNVAANGMESPTATYRAYVGPDDPASPKNVVLTYDLVSWEPVTEGANGGYIETADISYLVTINGEDFGNTSGTSLKVTLPADKPLTSYTALVSARYGEYTGEPGVSNKVVFGTPYSLPLEFEPTPTQFDLMTVYDANNDGINWYYNSVMNAAASSYLTDPSAHMDDYLFLPPVTLSDADKYYTFSFETGLISWAYTKEFVEAVVSTSPTASGIIDIIIDKYQPTGTPDYGNDYTDWNKLSGLIKVDKPGDYYIGLHCISEGGMLGLAARNFKVLDEGINASSPIAPFDLKAIGNAQGGSSATVSFTIPTETVDGSQIPSSENIKALLSVNGEKVKETEGNPGQNVSVEVNADQGYNSFSVQFKRGESYSAQSSVTIYVGSSVPATPTNVKFEANPDMMGGILSWDAVTEAEIPGAYLDPENVDYIIYRYEEPEGWYSYIEGVEDTFVEIEADDNTQAQYLLGVGSNNEFGTNGNLRYTSTILGMPYSLPFIEEFSASGFTTSPWFMEGEFNGQNYGGSVYLDVLSGIDSSFKDDSDYVLLNMSESGIAEMELMGMPRISTSGCDEATFSIDIVKGPDAGDLQVFGIVYGNNSPIHIGTVKGHNEKAVLSTENFTLPKELIGQQWIQIYLEMSFKSYSDYVAFSKVSVTQGAGVDSLSAQTEGYVTSDRDMIIIRGYEGKDYAVYTLDGKMISQGKTHGTLTEIPATKGIYVVKVADKAVKVIVR